MGHRFQQRLPHILVVAGCSTLLEEHARTVVEFQRRAPSHCRADVWDLGEAKNLVAQKTRQELWW